MKFFLFVVMLLGSVTMSWAGPFGVDIAEFDLEKYGCTEQSYQKDHYDCTEFPSPNELFFSYGVKYVASLGLCYIQSHGPEVVGDDDFGTGIQREVDQVQEMLSGVYVGSDPLKFDSALPNATFTSEDDWMFALHENERLYFYLTLLDPPVDEVVKYAVVAAPSPRADSAYVRTQFIVNDEGLCDD